MAPRLATEASLGKTLNARHESILKGTEATTAAVKVRQARRLIARFVPSSPDQTATAKPTARRHVLAKRAGFSDQAGSPGPHSVAQLGGERGVLAAPQEAHKAATSPLMLHLMQGQDYP